MKSALFIDFDNVYSALRRLDLHYAERFARQPLDWLRWLTDRLPLPEHAPTGSNTRRLLCAAATSTHTSINVFAPTSTAQALRP